MPVLSDECFGSSVVAPFFPSTTALVLCFADQVYTLLPVCCAAVYDIITSIIVVVVAIATVSMYHTQNVIFSLADLTVSRPAGCAPSTRPCISVAVCHDRSTAVDPNPT